MSDEELEQDDLEGADEDDGEELEAADAGDDGEDDGSDAVEPGSKPSKKAKAAEEVEELTSHKVGGVCPFGLPGPMTIYLDESLKIYDEVIPAGGSTHASVRLPLERLAELVGGKWVSACISQG